MLGMSVPMLVLVLLFLFMRRGLWGVHVLILVQIDRRLPPTVRVVYLLFVVVIVVVVVFVVRNDADLL
jgi:hypothetical protein